MVNVRGIIPFHGRYIIICPDMYVMSLSIFHWDTDYDIHDSSQIYNHPYDNYENDKMTIFHGKTHYFMIYMIPYGSKHCLRRYLTLQTISKWYPKHFLRRYLDPYGLFPIHFPPTPWLCQDFAHAWGVHVAACFPSHGTSGIFDGGSRPLFRRRFRRGRMGTCTLWIPLVIYGKP